MEHTSLNLGVIVFSDPRCARLNQILTFLRVFFKVRILDCKKASTASHWAACTTHYNIDTTKRGKRST